MKFKLPTKKDIILENLDKFSDNEGYSNKWVQELMKC